jgi:flagellar FliL protein
MASAAATADNVPEGADADADAPKKKKLSGKVIVLFIVLPLLVVLGGGGAALFLTGIVGGKKHEEKAEAKAPPPKPTLFVDLPDMLVNLNTGTRQASYLKLRVSLEVDDQATVAKLNEVMPRVLDGFQVFLRELRSDDLSGSAGLYRVKEELLIRVAAAVRPLPVKDVLFKEMLVQ